MPCRACDYSCNARCDCECGCETKEDVMDELIEQMAEAMDSIPADLRPTTLVNQDRARAALDAIEAGGRAIVELPGPCDRGPDDEFTDFPGVGFYVPAVFDAHPNRVQIRAGAWCDEPLGVGEARWLAASILAAADLAEASDA